MGRSLFGKLLLVYLIIVILLTTVSSLGLSRFFARYIVEQKQQQLLAQSPRITSLVNNTKAGLISREELKQALETIGHATNARVYVLDAGGKTFDQPQTATGPSDPGLLEDLERILAGETVVDSRRFVSTLNMPVVLVGTPLRNDQAVDGAILLLSPLTTVEKPLEEINRVLWTGALGTVTIAVVFIFIVSRRITRRISALGLAAARVAEGDYSQDVSIGGGDEVAGLARSFNIMQRKLQETERLRRELIADISHELRTPLSVIRGFVQGTLDGVIKPEEQRHYLSLALNETARLGRLVGDLLELARLQAGAVSLRRENLALSSILSEVADSFRLPAHDKGVHIDISAEKTAVVVQADHDRLKQILLNLVSNALRYTPTGGKIAITAAEGQDGMMIEVADTGPGVPVEELSRIFDKFHRPDKSRDSSTGGTGLGLAIAQQLVELHGGRITARNRDDGPGLAVTFNIPPAIDTLS